MSKTTPMKRNLSNMLSPKDFYEALQARQINFFSGVPDSLLKDFNAYLMDYTPSQNHIITANEGGAIALATGHYLATGKIPLVYMQNSGQGNCINPLTSLTDPEVYSIPMLLLIGWRGQPGISDEPQHIKQGRITQSLLDSLEIPYSTLPSEFEHAKKTLENAITSAQNRNAPYAILVRKKTFEPYNLISSSKSIYEHERESALKLVTSFLDTQDLVVSTTGKTSRELFEYRESLKQEHDKDFLTVGSMGHSSQIALGIAINKPQRQIYCFDGDGAAIMHLGSLAIIGQHAPKNYKHIIFNNGAHDSVGGQPTVGHNIDFLKIAEACGYKTTLRAKTTEEIKIAMQKLIKADGPSLLEILINRGARNNLGRPTISPIENKNSFMKNLLQ
jgi:phosphonopyruvate decarboxylase